MVIFLLGSVIKYLKNGHIIVLHNNGNVAINKQDGMWRSTNNKGKRKAARINSEENDLEMDVIPVMVKEDKETNCSDFISLNYFSKVLF